MYIDILNVYDMDIREEAIDRMLRLLHRFSRKLKLAICLPKLLEQAKFKNIFERHNNVREWKKMHKLCNSDHYWNDQQTSSIEDHGTCLKDGSMQVVSYQPESKPELEWAVILEILNKYENEVLPIVHDIIDEIDPNYAIFLNYVDLLKQIVEWQMRITPRQLRESKIELRNAEALIVRIQAEIAQFEGDLTVERMKYDDIVRKSEDEIRDLNIVIDEIKRKHREELELDMNRYKNVLCGLREDFVEEENNLDNQLEAHEAMLEKLVQADVEQEKSVREICIKAEKKYLIARNEYDRDLSKLNELKETLELQLRVTHNHCEILKNEYDVQSVLFTNLKKERELAMMQAFTEQLDNFEKNRAVRIIQRTWRAYHERISSKKKKRTRRNK